MLKIDKSIPCIGKSGKGSIEAIEQYIDKKFRKVNLQHLGDELKQIKNETTWKIIGPVVL